MPIEYKNMFDVKLDLESLKKLHKPRGQQQTYSNNKKKPKGLSSTLNEYVPGVDMPWNQRRASHLLRRMQFGAKKAEIQDILSDVPSFIVGNAVQQAKDALLPPAPDWVNETPPPEGSPETDFQEFFDKNEQWYIEYQQSWLDEMQENPLRERMTLFWHDHFATELSKYQLAAFTYRHFTVLRKHALGNFKDFVREIGLDHAMLIYLDGVLNRKGEPNENYARELLELFTMGIGHYTQDDITEIARALTGYFVDYFTFEKGFYPPFHDAGEKTFFGRNGNFGYDDVIDIIFEERDEEIAEFICTKLYQYFVYEVPNPVIVQGLKEVFLDNDFEIAPVVETLLKSEHFFDDEIIGAKIKSPVEFLLTMYQETLEQPSGEARELQPIFLFLLEQFLFNPPNVAGWPEHHSWLSTSTMPLRWLISQYNLFYVAPTYQVDFIAIAESMSDPNDPFKLSYDLAEFLLPVPLPEEEMQKLPDILLQGLPDYEWHLDFEGADIRILGLMNHLRQLPEYQLT